MAQRVKERANAQNLQTAWEQRVRTGNFSVAITGTREVRVFGKAGDAPVTFPQLRTPAPGETRTILQIGDQRDLGDGLTPTQRAENTLRLFLGATTYALLEQQHFLDVSSGLRPGRVYRVRRDPQKRYERRIRVFEGGRYVNDFCVVRAQSVPEADHYLTVYFGLIANEAWVLSVVGHGNVFSPWSDGGERETVPAVWQPRTAPTVAA
ncbi:MAG: hypothetical protein ACLFVO_11135 [Chloroflexaceae bacterium]